MRIDGLSKKEVAFLHVIWACDGEEQFLEWYVSLSERDRQTVESLMELIRQEYLNESLFYQEKYPEAAEICKRFMLNGNV